MNLLKQKKLMVMMALIITGTVLLVSLDIWNAKNLKATLNPRSVFPDLMVETPPLQNAVVGVVSSADGGLDKDYRAPIDSVYLSNRWMR